MHKRIVYIFISILLFLTSYSCIYGNFDSISENVAIVLDNDSSSILYSKNINKKIFPASTTKILTAILAIENLNLDSNITVSKTAIDNVPSGSSIMYLKIGEIVTVRQLLYGLLLPSGSDAANVLAEAISGSIPNFVVLMNKKLEEIGCINSHFTNPHGFHNDDHYSTAYDMAILMKYASKNEIFREICETKTYTIEETNKIFTTRKLENTNLLLSNNLDYILGGKTGYTEEAGNVFICYAKSNDKNIICCVYEGSKNIIDKKTRFIDTKMLLDNSFKNFDKTKIIDKDDIEISYIDKNNNTSYILGIDSDIYCLADKKPYILSYTLSDISLSNETITGKLSVHAENDNWNLDNTYEIKLIETNKYSNITSNSNTLLLYILAAMIVFLIMLLTKRRNIKNKRKKKITKK